MKAHMVFVMLLLMVFALLSCGGSGSGGNGDTEYTLTVSVTNGTYTITVDGETLTQADSYIITSGSTVVLQAMDTTDGYGFSTWGGDASSFYGENPITLIMSDNVTISAKFSPVIYVRSGSSGDGTRSNPYGDIQSAVNAADLGEEIHIAAGTYDTASGITVNKELTLKGGYKADDWNTRKYLTMDSRDDSLYKTAINCTAITGGTSWSAPTFAVDCGSSTEDSTVIEGLTINGGDIVAYTSGIRCQGGPIIQYCTVNGGAGTDTAMAIVTTATIDDPTIQYCYLHGGDSDLSDYHYGCFLLSNTGSATLQGNFIYGGDNAGDTNIGIRVDNASVIDGNIISGGSGGTHANGVECLGSAKVRNNLLFGGSATNFSTGVRLYGATVNAQVFNNTICGGINGTASNGIRLLMGATGSIQNNILFTAAVGNAYGIRESSADSDPTVCRNNNIFDCPNAIYYDFEGASANITDIADVNNLSDMTSSGNISVDLIGVANYFVDVDGEDDDITTMLDNDWRLTDNAPVNVRGGGLDLSSDFTTDFAGVTRTTSSPSGMTNDDAAGWSIGAHEWVD
jgi:hypothetical protein